MGKYLEIDSTRFDAPALYTVGDEHWREVSFRAVVTPVSFDQCQPAGGFCGILTRYQNENDYIALVLTKGYQVKLLRRTAGGFDLLAWAPLEFCIGQSLTLTLTISGNEIIGTAGPYSGKTTLKTTLPPGVNSFGGKAGFLCSAKARLGPHTAECSPAEAQRIDAARASEVQRIQSKRARFPKMKLDRIVPLTDLVALENIQFADINHDGKLEILIGQSSQKVAEQCSLTYLTSLTALDLNGTVLWQAGVPASPAEVYPSATLRNLPVCAHDLFGDGRLVVVCVFGYDVQVRDGKTGRVLMSAQTPKTIPVGDAFKNSFPVGPWGDETLNMKVQRLSFCDTQGNGGKKEIIVTDDNYNLAVLDPLAEPVLHPILTYRGNVGGTPWSGDIDQDGKDEISAGASIIDDNGSKIAALPLWGNVESVLALNSSEEDTTDVNMYWCGYGAGVMTSSVARLMQAANEEKRFLPNRLQGISPNEWKAGEISLRFARIAIHRAFD